ncbi:PREDICTED: uncharacterized protein LOC101308341 [Fragaria vesca subsp. vesca]
MSVYRKYVGGGARHGWSTIYEVVAYAWRDKIYIVSTSFLTGLWAEKRHDRYPRNSRAEPSQDRGQDRNPKGKSSQRSDVCFECKGVGHRAVDCANRRVRPQKALAVTYSDSEENPLSDQEEDTVAFTARVVPVSSLDHVEELVAFIATVSQNETPEDEDDDDRMQKFTELVNASKSMLSKIDILTKDLAKCEKEKVGIQAELLSQQEVWRAEKLSLEKSLSGLKAEKLALEVSLKESQQQFSRFSIGSEKLTKICGMGRLDKNKHGLGFETGENSKNGGTVFVKSKALDVKVVTNKEFARLAKGLSVPAARKPNKNLAWVKKKDSRPYALKPPHTDSKPVDECDSDPEEENIVCFLSRVWTSLESVEESRTVAVCRVALTALAARCADSWYIDSGASRHMTGDPKWFLSMDDVHPEGNVGFGDGARAPIVGSGTVNAPSLPCLKNVLLVKGLEVSLLSVSQIVDEHDSVTFDKQRCVVLDGNGKSIMRGKRTRDQCYCVVAKEKFSPQICFRSMICEEPLDLWHIRMCHLNHQDIVKLSSKEAVRGIPKLAGIPQGMCGECRVGKMTRTSHPLLNADPTTHVLELLHLDLVGPVETKSIGGRKYALVIVDDFSRFTWVKFLSNKGETFENYYSVAKRVTNEKLNDDMHIVRIRSDHGTEFENSYFENYCEEFGVHHEFSAPITLQHNGIVERKNMVLVELSKVMLAASGLNHSFWEEVVNNACYTLNRVILRPGTTMTPYEIWRGRKPNIAHLKVFGSPCFIYRDREYLTKFDAKSDKGVFLGYAGNSRAYRVYNKRTCKIMESVNVAVNDALVCKNDGCVLSEQEAEPTSSETKSD